MIRSTTFIRSRDTALVDACAETQCDTGAELDMRELLGFNDDSDAAFRSGVNGGGFVVELRALNRESVENGRIRYQFFAETQGDPTASMDGSSPEKTGATINEGEAVIVNVRSRFLVIYGDKGALKYRITRVA